MIQRMLSTLLGLLFLAAVFLLTSVLVAIGLTAGLLLAGWIWWRGRGRGRSGRGRVVEGEYRIIDSR